MRQWEVTDIPPVINSVDCNCILASNHINRAMKIKKNLIIVNNDYLRTSQYSPCWSNSFNQRNAIATLTSYNYTMTASISIVLLIKHKVHNTNKSVMTTSVPCNRMITCYSTSSSNLLRSRCTTSSSFHFCHSLLSLATVFFWVLHTFLPSGHSAGAFFSYLL